MVNHPLHRLFVPLFYPFTYHSLIWLNNSIIELSKNDIKASVNISSYTEQNPYIFPSDGYVCIEVSTGVQNYLYGYIVGNNNNQFNVQVSGAYSNVRIPVYVRKGMKWFKVESLGSTQVCFYAFQ